MSEYVQKHALVKWLEHEYETCSDELTGFRAFDRVKRKIQSGVFDPKDDLDEIQRLRAALGHIHAIAQSELDDLQYEGQRKTWEEILLTVEDALKGDGNE